MMNNPEEGDRFSHPDTADEDEDDEEEWADEQAEDEHIDFFPICSIEPKKTILEALKYDADKHKFNLLAYLPPFDSDDFFEKTIICINKARLFVKEHVRVNDDIYIGTKLNEYLKKENESICSEEEDERYFKPVLENDNMIMCMDDLQDIVKSMKSSSISASHMEDSNVPNENVTQLKSQIEALEEQLQNAKEYVTKLAEANSKDSNTKDTEGKGSKRDNDTYYFSSYSHSSIHETMLQDTIRTKAYQNAILSNKGLFEGKTVMDIGCGTGILSLFAAQAGAKKVVAIDASDVHVQAREIVELNGFGNIINVVHGKVEDLIASNSLPLEEGERVDIVISEWMGYALLYETMLPSVMAARNQFMDKSHGTMWPNKSNMFIEGATDSRIDYWDNVYGVNMIPMKSKVVNELRKEASVEVVDKETVVTNRFELISFDLNLCSDEDLDFEATFELKPCGQDDAVKLDKLVISFDVDFDLPEFKSVSFSTSCQTELTHWKQTSLWFDPDDAPLLQPDEVLKGTFSMARNDLNQRDMDFVVIWEVGMNNKEARKKGTIVSRLSS